MFPQIGVNCCDLEVLGVAGVLSGFPQEEPLPAIEGPGTVLASPLLHPWIQPAHLSGRGWSGQRTSKEVGHVDSHSPKVGKNLLGHQTWAM